MNDVMTGRITFGPARTPIAEDWHREFLSRARYVVPSDNIQPCNCIGPQLGQTKCPCALRAESNQGARMVRDGVTIDGVRYRLVRDDAP